ncbi:hypothetical protein ONZ45_g677 [Pleurotus djamor]|nr:hypothetical protein ONZ45_g677 [Pleurotus djamor]
MDSGIRNNNSQSRRTDHHSLHLPPSPSALSSTSASSTGTPGIRPSPNSSATASSTASSALPRRAASSTTPAMIAPTSSFYDPNSSQLQHQQQSQDARAQEYHQWAQHQNLPPSQSHPQQMLHHPLPRTHLANSTLTSAMGDAPDSYNQYGYGGEYNNPNAYPDSHGELAMSTGGETIAAGSYHQVTPRTQPSMGSLPRQHAQGYHHPQQQQRVEQHPQSSVDTAFTFYPDNLAAEQHTHYGRQDANLARVINSAANSSVGGNTFRPSQSNTYSPSSTTLSSPFTQAQSVSPAHGMPGHPQHVQQHPRPQYPQAQHHQGQQPQPQQQQMGAGLGLMAQQQYGAHPDASQAVAAMPSQPGVEMPNTSASGNRGKRKLPGAGRGAAKVASGGAGGGGGFGSGGSGRKRARGRDSESDSDDEGFALLNSGQEWSMASEIRVGLAGISVFVIFAFVMGC